MMERGKPEGIRRRGRPRVQRRMDPCGPLRCYAPQCDTPADEEIVVILPEELELLKLVDLNGLAQEEASAVMGVSRRTVWKDLHEARKKVADALIHGKRIEIGGCVRRIEGTCPQDIAFSPVPGERLCRRRHGQGEWNDR